MATASRSKAGWITAGFVVIALAAVALTVLNRDQTSPPAPVAVDAESIYQFATLDEMVAATDAVVVASVQSVDRGRLVGDPGAGGVISRIVTLAVDDVLAGTAAANIIVEEEGWLADGTPIVVNGVEPSEVGDHGVWFLDTIDGAELSSSIVINSQGRYLSDPDGVLRGGDQRDPLVQLLQQHTLDELINLVRSP